MAKIEILAPWIRSWEGGFANVKGDSGGATNMGVTIATWKDYCKKKGIQGTVASLRTMTIEQWTDIFRTGYWNRWMSDNITDQNIANILVDWIWMSGPATIRKVQQLLGVEQDGIVGTNTLSELNKREQKKLFDAIHDRRMKFIDDIVKRNPSQKKFRTGWIRRLNSIQYGELLKP